MYKMIMIEIVARYDKVEEYRANQDKKQKIYDQHGFPRKVWAVDGRKLGQYLVEYGPFESREAAETALAEMMASEEWRAVQREQTEAELLLPGSQESFLLSDD